MTNLLNKIFSFSKNLNQKYYNFDYLKNNKQTSILFSAIEDYSKDSEIRYVGGCIRKILKNGKTVRLTNKLNFYVLIAMPKIGCSTKDIFSKVRKFSKPLYLNRNKSFFGTNNLVHSNNDLENIVFNKYSKIKNLKHFLSSLPGVVFVRMTGAGSAVVAYFKSKETAKNAAIIFKNKYKSYWYIVSKTI